MMRLVGLLSPKEGHQLHSLASRKGGHQPPSLASRKGGHQPPSLASRKGEHQLPSLARPKGGHQLPSRASHKGGHLLPSLANQMGDRHLHSLALQPEPCSRDRWRPLVALGVLLSSSPQGLVAGPEPSPRAGSQLGLADSQGQLQLQNLRHNMDMEVLSLPVIPRLVRVEGVEGLSQCSHPGLGKHRMQATLEAQVQALKHLGLMPCLREV